MDRQGIAARVRELLAAEQPHDVAELARRLDVSELSLRMTIDDVAPHPTIEVLSAVVAYYGVDPSWILTGVYDSGKHRRALEGSGPGDSIGSVMAELTAPHITPVSPSSLEIPSSGGMMGGDHPGSESFTQPRPDRDH